MLFQRIYNWIKYKTLPSSFLFKNRLFIERDSKHRRILSNFGLSFRNSKWSNYEVFNIKSHFKTNYSRYFFFIIFFISTIFFISYFNKYYIFSYFSNTLSFIFWISVDTLDYYLSFIVWIFTISLSLFFNLIYSYFFFNNFSNAKSTEKIFLNRFFIKFSPNTDNKNNYISKHDLNLILYSWLNNPNSIKNTKVLENLFDNKINNKWWNNYYDFFIKLYKVSYLLNISSDKNSIYFLNNNLSTFFNKNFKNNNLSLINYFNNNNLINSNSNLILHYLIKQSKNYFELKNQESSSLSILKNNYEWNLYNFSNELTRHSFLIKNKSGLFFLNDFNYGKFSFYITNFEELWTLNSFFKNQLISAKWNRWLYRYSILHRKILKNSHKLTLAKKLLNSGFYDSKIFTNNIWATAHLNKLQNTETFSAVFNILYENLFNDSTLNFSNNQININNNYTQKNSLNLLNFFENSYFWYLKRYYNFNTISNNLIKSKLQTNNNLLEKLNSDVLNINNETNKHFFLINYLLNSSYLNLNQLSHFNNNYTTFYENYNVKTTTFVNLKDFYLLNNSNDLLIKDNLNILYWVTSSFNQKNSLSLFNYNAINTDKFKISSYSLIDDRAFNNNLNFWLVYSLVNLDKFYLNDLNYLSLFL